MLRPLALALALLPVSAQADDSPATIEDLVQFFANSVDLGAPKGLCIGTPQDCAEQARPPSRDMLVTFELDSATLTAEARDSLDIYATAMQDARISALAFSVEGHTDGRGSPDYNTALSEARAETVLGYLVAKGIAPTRLRASGFGETKPRVEDTLDPGNRRVEMRVDLR